MANTKKTIVSPVQSKEKLNTFLRAPLRHGGVVLLTNIDIIVVQPVQIFEQVIATVCRQFKIVGHDNCFSRTYFRTKIAQNANLKVYIVRVDHFALLLWIWIRFACQRNAFRWTDAGTLIAYDALIRIEMLYAAKTVGHFKRNIWVFVGDLLRRHRLECNA